MIQPTAPRATPAVEMWPLSPKMKDTVSAITPETTMKIPLRIPASRPMANARVTAPASVGLSSPVVATELLSPAISSALFPTDYTGLNPHVKYFVARHGYLRCTVEAERLTAEYQLVSDVQDPNATIATDATWVITAGSPQAVRA